MGRAGIPTRSCLRQPDARRAGRHSGVGPGPARVAGGGGRWHLAGAGRRSRGRILPVGAAQVPDLQVKAAQVHGRHSRHSRTRLQPTATFGCCAPLPPPAVGHPRGVAAAGSWAAHACWCGASVALANMRHLLWLPCRTRSDGKLLPGPGRVVPLVGGIIEMVRDPYAFWEQQRR